MAALCVRCKKNQAVLFVSRMENGEMKSEGYCLKCAKELGMKPIDDVLNNLGLKEEDLDAICEQANEILGGELMNVDQNNVPPRPAAKRQSRPGAGRSHRSQPPAPSKRQGAREEVPERLLHRPDGQSQGRAAGRAHRPGNGAAADHADLKPTAEEQPLPHRRTRRGQDRHRGRSGPADRPGKRPLQAP